MSPDANRSRNYNARKICRSIMDAITDAILLLDPHTFRILDVNRCATEVYGYSRKELLGMQLRELTNDVPTYAELLNPKPGVEATHMNSRGEKLDFLVSLSLIEYWGRKAVLSINRDVRDMKRMHASVAANETKFRLLIHNISEIVSLIDRDGVVKFVSPQIERVLGISPAEAMSRDVFEFVHPEERARARQEYAQTVREPGEAIPSILRFRDVAGRWVPFEIIANNQLHEPDVAGVIFTARDLRYRRELEDSIRRANVELDKRVEERTMELARANAALRLENRQRRYTEKQLQESLSLLNATLEATADGILVVSLDGVVRSYNQKFVDMWRFPAATLAVGLQEDLLRWAAPQLENPDEFLRNVRSLYAAPEESSLDTLKLKDGRIIERYSKPQTVGDKITGRVVSFRDITQAHELQSELNQAQKMEAVGRLAGGVAHDFNNVLMLISGYASQLLEDQTLSDSARALSNQLVTATNRAAALTRQLLAFSRKHPVSFQVIDLNVIVSEMQSMLSRLLSDQVRLNLNVQSEALPVYADRSQIELMIVNLALNARDAMPHGGVLAVSTKAETLESDDTDALKISTNYVVLQVSDTGHGMPPEISAHIFEPFFTTKDVGKGTGLGLSTVYGIVEQAGGHITVESEPGNGTTFRVYFPRADQPVSIAEAKPEPEPGKGHETILLVEDEEGIRTMTRTYLQGLGYEVLEAATGPDALRVSREHKGVIHLLLSDILMPEMRGDELARQISAERPDILTVFISGYANVHELDPKYTVIEKPFAFPDLGRQVREILDDRTAPDQLSRAS
ncbi:MAG TPA: PAS domain S-box protein [Candidatus Angelobacter sp.]|jgi:PAS domain S-box-containing protein